MSSIKKRTTGKFVNESVPLLGTIEDIKRRKTAISSNQHRTYFQKTKVSHKYPKYKHLKHISNLHFFINVKFGQETNLGRRKLTSFKEYRCEYSI